MANGRDVIDPNRERRADREAAQLARTADYRQRFLRSVVRKPLYTNNHFDTDPWQLIGRVADETVRAAMLDTAADDALSGWLSGRGIGANSNGE